MDGLGQANTIPRVLCVLAFFPSEPRRDVHGVFQRIRLFVDGLSTVARELDLLFIAPPRVDVSPARVAEHEAALRAEWNPRVNVTVVRRAPAAQPGSRPRRLSALLAGTIDHRRQPAFAPFVGDEAVAGAREALARRPSLCFVHDLRGMTALTQAAAPLPPLLFDADNLEHRLQARRLWRSPAWRAERLRLSWIPAVLRAELAAYRRARRVFVCSEPDARFLERLGLRNVITIPNAVAIPHEALLPARGKRLLFVASLNYAPNADAAQHFVTNIWPRIRAAEPGAEFHVAGREPEQVAASAHPPDGVRFLGFVDDLQAAYAEAAVVVCPIRVGAGTRIKLVEAAALGKPIVSTTIGAEGLHLADGTEILLRDTPDAFADACVFLLRDRKIARRLGLAARERAERLYSREAAIAGIAAAALETVGS